MQCIASCVVIDDGSVHCCSVSVLWHVPPKGWLFEFVVEEKSHCKINTTRHCDLFVLITWLMYHLISWVQSVYNATKREKIRETLAEWVVSDWDTGTFDRTGSFNRFRFKDLSNFKILNGSNCCENQHQLSCSRRIYGDLHN